VNIKINIRSLLSQAPSIDSVRDFVTICHKIAVVYLRKKSKIGKLDPSFLGLSLEDLALDCIADLFQRNDKNEFIQLKRYFSNFNIEELSETDLLSYVRRLIFSTVNQQLFRRYKSSDPQLAKIIRNLKEFIKSSREVSLRIFDQELWICESGMIEKNQYRPFFPSEFLESILIESIGGNINIKSMVMESLKILKYQDEYLNRFPLTEFARIIQSIFIKLNLSEYIEVDTDRILSFTEIEKFIEESIKIISRGRGNDGIQDNEKNGEVRNNYFLAVKDILLDEFSDGHLPKKSYYEHLNQYYRMSFEEYKGIHRNRLEYLVKLTREHFINSLKNDFGIPP
jgi:hypothetical protein